MSESNLQYPGKSLHDWLQRQRGASRHSGEELQLLAELADTLFFASLGKEEGELTRVRVVYHLHGLAGLQDIREHVLVGSARYARRAWELIPFEAEPAITDFSVKALMKIAPAANLPRTSVVVGPCNGRLTIQGIARRVEYEHIYETNEESVLVFCAPEPGHLTLSIEGEEVFRYEQGSLVAPTRRVLLHDLLFNTSSIVKSALMQMCASILTELAESWLRLPENKAGHISHVIYNLVNRMREMRHGGLIALLPDSNAIDTARTTGKYRIPREAGIVLRNSLKDYVASRTGLENLFWQRTTKDTPESDDEALEKAIAHQQKEHDEEELEALVGTIGQLTTVDNALLLGPNLEVICAGYPIPTQGQKPTVYETQTLSGEPCEPYDIGQHGSRHRAAASFANQHPGGLTFVASQDGPLRCLHRPSGEDKVLLWNLRIPDE